MPHVIMVSASTAYFPSERVVSSRGVVARKGAEGARRNVSRMTAGGAMRHGVQGKFYTHPTNTEAYVHRWQPWVGCQSVCLSHRAAYA